MQKHATVEMPTSFNRRDPFHDLFTIFLHKLEMRTVSREPLLVVYRDVDRTVKRFGPGGVCGVEVRVGYDDGFEAAFGFDL